MYELTPVTWFKTWRFVNKQQFIWLYNKSPIGWITQVLPFITLAFYVNNYLFNLEVEKNNFLVTLITHLPEMCLFSFHLQDYVKTNS